MTRPLAILILAIIPAITFAAEPATSTAPSTAPATKPADNLITLTGKLSTGIMAIGGETTGTILVTADKITYELDIKAPLLQRKAEELNGKDVTVTGILTIKAGVEIKQRTILTVGTLEAAKDPAATPPGSAPAK